MLDMSGIERSLVVFKPDAISRAFIGEIMSRFERAGLKIVGAKMVAPNRDFFYHHYETIGKMISRRGEKVFNWTLEYVQKTPVLALVLEGPSAVQVVRKMAGTTEPFSAQPWTIRGDYSHVNFWYADGAQIAIMNLLHASGDSEEAAQEVAHWFKPEELFDYDRVDHVFMY